MKKPTINSIDQAIRQVTDFHDAIGAPIASLSHVCLNYFCDPRKPNA